MEVIERAQNYDSSFADQWINLAEERLGTKVLFATDDFFAPKENLIKPGRGVFIHDKYTEFGKWMDGWESRRKRTEGHDYCDIKLGLSGVIRGVDIDTNFFTGNHPAAASVEACCVEGDLNESTEWVQIIPKMEMGPGQQHLIEVHNEQRFTHVRLHIYPDGGVARFRVFGEVRKDWCKVSPKDEIDLAAVENEGRAVICNDMYFSHKDNINAPGRGVNMGDGWETKRKRGPGHDWLILALGKRGKISRVVCDTAHFKGNYPDRFSLEAADLEEGKVFGLNSESIEWKELLPESKLSADKEHTFTSELKDVGACTHVRINIFPDGGVSRLRLFGHIEK